MNILSAMSNVTWTMEDFSSAGLKWAIKAMLLTDREIFDHIIPHGARISLQVIQARSVFFKLTYLVNRSELACDGRPTLSVF